MSPSGSVPVALNATAAPTATLPAGSRVAVTDGSRLGWVTTIVSVVSPVPPLPSETVTLAVLVPAVL